MWLVRICSLVVNVSQNVSDDMGSMSCDDFILLKLASGDLARIEI